MLSERMIALDELHARLIVSEEFWASCRLGGASGKALSSFSLELSTRVVIPPWRSLGIDLSAVISWAGLGLNVAEPHAVSFLCPYQLDLERVSEFRSIERFRTQDTGHHTPIVRGIQIAFIQVRGYYESELVWHPEEVGR